MAHLDFIRSLPCLITGARDVEAAHIRYGNMRWGKRSTGIGEKPDDQWVVPLSQKVHREQHDFGDEELWWREKGIDPVLIALALWRASGDEQAGKALSARRGSYDEHSHGCFRLRPVRCRFGVGIFALVALAGIFCFHVRQLLSLANRNAVRSLWEMVK